MISDGSTDDNAGLIWMLRHCPLPQRLADSHHRGAGIECPLRQVGYQATRASRFRAWRLD